MTSVRQWKVGLLFILMATALIGVSAELRFGEVTIDPDARRLRFPAVVNQTNGLIEYLLVHESGKVHESLLTTRVQPRDLHAAALLLGLTNPAPISIHIRLPSPARSTSAPATVEAAELILVTDANIATTAISWTYSGSVQFDGKLLAQSEGSIVALIEDDTALASSDHPMRARDDVWAANEVRLPGVGTSVEVIFTRNPPKP